MNAEAKRAYLRQYRVDHKESLRIKAHNHYLSNKEAILSKCRAYHLSHRSEAAKRQKEYYHKNRTWILTKMSKYQRAHPEMWKKRVARYEALHPDRVRSSKKKWRDAHKLENLMKAKARRARIRKSYIDMAAVTQFFTWIKNQDYVTCTYCGHYITGKSVHIDHIVPLSRGGAHDPDNFAVSCGHCNQSKSDKLLHEWPNCPDKFKNLILN